jgi:hypothetical protein
MLSNLQLHLLKTFSRPLPEEQVSDIQKILAEYFLEQMDLEMDKLIIENNWNEQTFVDWSKEHNRTPYKTNNK